MNRTKKKPVSKKQGRAAALSLMAMKLELAKGEKWRGIVLDKQGKPSHHLILLPARFKGSGDHAAVLAWAEKIGADLPTKPEGALLYAANADGAIEKGVYWLKDTYAGDAECAWYQYFLSGNQYDWLKSDKFRGVAVRRVPIR